MCEICGEVRDPTEPGHDLIARDHWEAHVLPLEEPFDFFSNSPGSNVKTKLSGSWVDVFLGHHSLRPTWRPVPSYRVAVDMVAAGRSRWGMGEELEWARGALSSESYAEVVSALTARGQTMLSSPSYVVDERSYIHWSFSVVMDCSYRAVIAFFDAAMNGSVDVPMREWVARFDADQPGVRP